MRYIRTTLQIALTVTVLLVAAGSAAARVAHGAPLHEVPTLCSEVCSGHGYGLGATVPSASRGDGTDWATVAIVSSALGLTLVAGAGMAVLLRRRAQRSTVLPG